MNHTEGFSYQLLQRRQRRYDTVRLCVFACLFILITIVALSAGDQWIAFWHWRDEAYRLFIWQIRLPRIIAVVMVGASLAVAGCVMQALFDNPLAEPGLLGISNGAGVTLMLLIVFSDGSIPTLFLGGAAMLGALLVTLLLLFISLRRHIDNSRMLLIGIAISMISGALMTWSIYFSSSIDLRQLLYWLMGGFGGVSWQQISLAILLLPALCWAASQGRILNILALGEHQATQLGLSIRYWRALLVLAVGWIIGLSVALAGVIGFIGLLVPHILRLSGMTEHRYLLTGCALSGGTLLLLADLLARIALESAEVPVGVVTATLGAPIFIWLLLNRKLA